MAEPILTVEHLVKGYGENTVLDDVSLAVRPGEVIVVVGPSGCGKSTLLRCINALEPTQSGRVRLGNETVAYGGKGLTSLRQRIGMVFQSYELFPHLTVLDNVMLAPLKRWPSVPKAEVQQEAESLLDRVEPAGQGQELPAGVVRRPEAARRHCPCAGYAPRDFAVRRGDGCPGPRNGPRGAGRHAGSWRSRAAR